MPPSSAPANRTLSNNLDVLRSPVAREAYAAFVEVGYDVLPWLAAPSPNRLDLFIRLDAYDSMAAVPDETFDNPRFARRVYTLGTNYNMEDTVGAQSRLRHAATRCRPL